MTTLYFDCKGVFKITARLVLSKFSSVTQEGFYVDVIKVFRILKLEKCYPFFKCLVCCYTSVTLYRLLHALLFVWISNMS